MSTNFLELKTPTFTSLVHTIHKSEPNPNSKFRLTMISLDSVKNPNQNQEKLNTHDIQENPIQKN
jgi:hypothetical protein